MKFVKVENENPELFIMREEGSTFEIVGTLTGVRFEGMSSIFQKNSDLKPFAIALGEVVTWNLTRREKARIADEKEKDARVEEELNRAPRQPRPTDGQF